MMSAKLGLTIDELARRHGLTVRNLRAYQTAGLLPRPRLQGRTGVYGPEHLARLDAIARLRARGWSLAAIADALAAAASGVSAADLVGASAARPASGPHDWLDELFDELEPAAATELVPARVWN